MASFLPAVELTLQHEGGFVDNPADRGGATNFGILQRDMPDVNIRDISQAEAVAWYQKKYWLPEMGQLTSQPVANKLFDMGVLLSPATAVRLLQRALGFSTASQTGQFTPETLACANDAGDNLLPDYQRILIDHFNWIVETYPSQRVFLDGWTKRIES